MALSRDDLKFWNMCIIFLVLPHINVGLLSDFKICGDSECESRMSRVRAVMDHHGKDCRFLNFRQGDTIFVYHKLTGKSNNIWAGIIHKQFGYFVKEAVKEEQTFTTQEIIVETQESDFFCMDEFGYPIDSSHLDTDGDDTDLKAPPKEAETRHYTDASSGDVSTAPDTPPEEVDENKKEGDGAAKTYQESPETQKSLREQAGSLASSWLSTSVVGWFDQGKEEELDNTKQQMQAEDSTTGWLGFGKEDKSESTEYNINNGQQEIKSVDSFTSTMTGWLGFGGDKTADSTTEKEVENFRSRKLYLDLDTQKLQEEPSKETGALDWLGNGLSRTLGFGLNNQDTGDKIQVSRAGMDEEEKQPASDSWFDLGIGDILAFRKDNSESGTESDAGVNKEETSAVDGTSQIDQKDNHLHNRLEDVFSFNDKDKEDNLDRTTIDQDFIPQNDSTFTESVSQIEDSKSEKTDFTNEVDEGFSEKNQDHEPEDQENLDTAGDNADTESYHHEFIQKEERSPPKFTSDSPKSTQTISEKPPEEERRDTYIQDAKYVSQMMDFFKESGFESSPRLKVEDEEEKEDEKLEIEEKQGKMSQLQEYNDKDKEMQADLEVLDGKNTKENEELKKLENSNKLEVVRLEEMKQEEVMDLAQTVEKSEAEDEADEFRDNSNDEKQREENEEGGELVKDMEEAHKLFEMKDLDYLKREELKEMQEISNELVQKTKELAEEELQALEENKRQEDGKLEEIEDKKQKEAEGKKLAYMMWQDSKQMEVDGFEHKKCEEIKTFAEKKQEEDDELVQKLEDDNKELTKTQKLEALKDKQEEVERSAENQSEFEHEKQDDVNRSDRRDDEVLQKKTEEEVEDVEEELVRVKDDGKEEVKVEPKTAEVKDDSHDVAYRRNAENEMESLECSDELCTQSDQDGNIRDRKGPPANLPVEDRQHDKNEEVVGVLTGTTKPADNDVTYLHDKGDGGPHMSPDHLYSVDIIEKTDMCDGMDAKCANGKMTDPVPSKVQVEENDVVTPGSEGIFGLFKKAVISFGQRPITQIKESTESDGKTSQISKPQPLQTPEQEVDSTASHFQREPVYPPSPLPTPKFHPTSPPKHLPKHYKNVQSHMSIKETIILTELLGKNKLQFLDYILGSREVFTEDVHSDESILLDIETLLRYHRETQFAPNMKLSGRPEENQDKTATITAIEKLELLLEKMRHTFNTRKSDHKAHPSETMEAGPSQRMGLIEGEEMDDTTLGTLYKESRSQTEPPHSLKGLMVQIQDFLQWIHMQVVSSLPDDIRPGPDLYGVPWEPVVISSLVGLMTLLLFGCRCYFSVKSRMYRRKERWMAEQVAQLLDEKCKVLETLSECQLEYDKLENSLRESGVLVQTHKTRDLEVKARQLNHDQIELEEDLKQLKDQLHQQKEHNLAQEKQIALLEESTKTMEEETKELQSQEEQSQTTLKVYAMNSDRLQRNLETAGEENTLLQESNTQLRQQVEGWAERVSELEQEMRRCEMAHRVMLQDVANKDERIMSLTDRLLGMKAWDAELEGDGGDTSNGTPGREEEKGKSDITTSQVHLQKVQKLIYAAKLNADLKSVDEDKDRVFAKLNDEVKAKEDLEVSIKELETEQLSMQADTEHYSEEVQRLQQKLHIMTEMYQENELKLHRLLTVEEKERLQKEEKLNKADKYIALAMEELNNYRLRAEEMEEELEKTKQSYQTQISAHEKKAHNNWLAARAADRELADIKRENALFRQKITDTQFKLDALEKDPFALDSLARPLPFRAERLPYGPSPLGRPASESRALLSSPTLLEGPLTRLSPRVSRAPGEPPGGQGELERSGGPHSDSGSISPSWERDRRGPPPGPPGPFLPQGYMFPEPGGPMYRRPGPPPGVMGPLPPPGPPFPHPRGLSTSGPLGSLHPADMTDGTYKENSLGLEMDDKEPVSSDRRTPPESDPRTGVAPLPGPPIDSQFSRRAPHGPPDFYPPRGPGGPPRMPMWAPPPGMMFPPRFPHGGPPPPHPLSYGPPMRPPPPDGFLPPSMVPPPSQQNLPPLPHSQSPDEHTSSS
uniref:transport and Golgi organization protein 1 homolog isoform X2 n=1 Tax=Doryrhamphus excisus TaxID=161450 RepID=UPI0025AE6DAA|nr:transport and Golgi organization protein 1 homolog isoform X2 [Doryrhamphus excisus]